MTLSRTFSPGKNIACCLALTCFAVAAKAQGIVQGRITDARTGQPVRGASVGLRGTTQGTDTDANGDYRLANVPAGTYTLGVRMVGFTMQERTILVAGDQPLSQSFSLAESQQDLDEVTVTGSHNRYRRPNASNSLRLGEPLLEAAQNIQVVTSQLLADQQIFTPVEGITRNVSGAVAPGHWNNVYARINIRGFNTGYGSLRNGMSTGNYFGPLAEDASFIERVEFVKGPGGFLVSNTEAGGFYNVVLKAPTGVGRKSVGLTLGSFGQYRATADLDGKLSQDNKLQYRLNVMGQSLDSYQGYDFNRKVALAPSLRYQLDDKTTITAQYVYQFSNFSAAGNYVFSPSGYKSLPQDFSLYDPTMGSSRVNDHSAFANIEHRLNDNWKVTAQAGYLRYAMRGISNWVGAGSFNPLASFTIPGVNGGAPVAGTNVLNRSLFLYDVDNTTLVGQAFLNGTVQTGAVQHRIIVGLDASNKSYAADFGAAGFLAQDITRPTYYGTAPTTLSDQNALRARDLDQRGPTKGLTKYAGLYVQDELGFFDNVLRLTLAARYSNNNNVTARVKKDVVTPRFGLSATVAPNTAVYALYDQSFTPQTATDKAGNTFDPQRGRNIEAGVKRDWLDGRFSTTLTAFNITKTNVPTAEAPRDPAFPNAQVALGEVRSRGIEADFTGELLPGLNLVANYAFLDPTITKDNARTDASGTVTTASNVGQKLGGTARHNTNAWLNYRFQQGILKGFGLSGGMQWQVERYSGLGNVAQILPDNYYRLDAGVSWQGEHLSANLLVNNVTGRYNYIAGAYTAATGPGGTITKATDIGALNYWQPEAPTNFRLTLGYSF